MIKIGAKADYEELENVIKLIPDVASEENQLADKAFVNSSINNYAAFYITKNANGDAFGTFAELSSATKFYNAGEERTPAKNDYLVVLEDETKTTSLGVNPTTRYTYQGTYPDGQWEFQYIVNNTSLTQAQVNAINSGITQEMVDNRVIPSNEHPGFAANADFTGYAGYANYAEGAGWASNADIANSATNASFAAEATHAETAGYAPDYTPLSTFNETLGNLSTIIHGI